MPYLTVDDTITLELLDVQYTQSLLKLVDSNRMHLRQWLPWVDKMNTAGQFKKFAEESVKRYQSRIEVPLILFENGKIAGRTGIYNIDHNNRIASIGYWLGKEFQGKGIIIKSTAALITFAFERLELNRIEIKCGTENFKSQAVPERLNFFMEGIVRQGELHDDTYIDLLSYSMLKQDWKKNLE